MECELNFSLFDWLTLKAVGTCPLAKGRFGFRGGANWRPVLRLVLSWNCSSCWWIGTAHLGQWDARWKAGMQHVFIICSWTAKSIQRRNDSPFDSICIEVAIKWNE